MKQSVSWKQLRGKHPSFDLLPWEVKDTLASKFRRSKIVSYNNIALRSRRALRCLQVSHIRGQSIHFFSSIQPYWLVTLAPKTDGTVVKSSVFTSPMCGEFCSVRPQSIWFLFPALAEGLNPTTIVRHCCSSQLYLSIHLFPACPEWPFSTSRNAKIVFPNVTSHVVNASRYLA